MNATEIPGTNSVAAFQEPKGRTIAGSVVFDTMDAIAVIVSGRHRIEPFGAGLRAYADKPALGERAGPQGVILPMV